ncbi:hypothetical protein JOQ06_007323 [Pogonophryne albipinna]|uniref:Uncharacterized protein n=1 Tax=Pogonophryne albipinna TaxID=1090488 RepID=A0AAD6AYR8_9TELE|nr:hypothetical protein JOQ06_007323 [Pogonophryne albipinna]
MEPLPGYEAYGARPRRQTRLPTRYADYDVDHLGYISQRYRQEEETFHLEGKARMTPLTSPNDSPPPRHLNRRDANFQEMDFSYGAGSQQLFPEREPRDRFREYSTHLPTSLHYRPPREDDRVELENIRQERFLLQQTQRRMSSDIDELKALRADMRQLVDTVRNLQTPSLHSNKPELTVMQPPAPFVGEPDSEDEDDWPAPPPWPDPVSGELLPGDYITPHHPNGRPDELPPKEEGSWESSSRPEGRQGKHHTTVLHGAKDTWKKPDSQVPE